MISILDELKLHRKLEEGQLRMKYTLFAFNNCSDYFFQLLYTRNKVRFQWNKQTFLVNELDSSTQMEWWLRNETLKKYFANNRIR